VKSRLTLKVALCSLSMLTSVWAQASAIEQFKLFVTKTNSARGEFSQQQMKMENGAPKFSKLATGTFVFARPGKFIWTYQKPYEQILQADGEKLYIYDKDLNQVTSKALGNALGSSPAAILFGSTDLEKSFTLKDIGEKQGMEWLEAVPKTKDSTFSSIGIGMKDGVPQGLELRDNFGQTSVLTLKNFEKNPSLKSDQFKFVMPKDADLLQQ
jgi:outer membrane lipoprotein carrier protein